MILDRARQLFRAGAGFGGFRSGNSARLILTGVQLEYGQAASDEFIREAGLGPGIRLERGLMMGKVQ